MSYTSGLKKGISRRKFLARTIKGAATAQVLFGGLTACNSTNQINGSGKVESQQLEEIIVFDDYVGEGYGVLKIADCRCHPFDGPEGRDSSGSRLYW